MSLHLAFEVNKSLRSYITLDAEKRLMKADVLISRPKSMAPRQNRLRMKSAVPFKTLNVNDHTKCITSYIHHLSSLYVTVDGAMMGISAQGNT